MDEYLRMAERIVARVEELATISEEQNSITRTFGSPAFIRGRNRIEAWMREAGLETRVDNIGNLRGKFVGSHPEAKTFVIASHIDTVVNAGKWDGPLGVIAGIDLIDEVRLKKTAVPFHIELIAFCDEEGVRFHTTYLGSKVVAGAFEDFLLERTDAAGTTLGQVIEAMGGDVTHLDYDSIPSENWLGYLEIHIEQGPVLYEQNLSVAVVDAIAGQHRIEIAFKGMAGHAGTVPMPMRQDALCCASEFVVAVEKYAQEHQDKLVATVGKLKISNAASNVIPGEVICSLDVRSADEKVLESAVQHLGIVCSSISTRRKIEMNWTLVQSTKPVECDAALNRLLAQAIEETGVPVTALVSGAGHDAVPVSAVAPVTMLFVRCYKGISHNPLEGVELKDIEATLMTADKFIDILIKKYTR